MSALVTPEQIEEIQLATDSITPSGFMLVFEDLVDHGRWTLIMQRVVRQESTGRFFRLTYEVPNTEYQDVEPPTVDDVVEVFPKEVVRVIYVEDRP